MARKKDDKEIWGEIPEKYLAANLATDTPSPSGIYTGASPKKPNTIETLAPLPPTPKPTSPTPEYELPKAKTFVSDDIYREGDLDAYRKGDEFILGDVPAETGFRENAIDRIISSLKAQIQQPAPPTPPSIEDILGKFNRLKAEAGIGASTGGAIKYASQSKRAIDLLGSLLAQEYGKYGTEYSEYGKTLGDNKNLLSNLIALGGKRTSEGGKKIPDRWQPFSHKISDDETISGILNENTGEIKILGIGSDANKTRAKYAMGVLERMLASGADLTNQTVNDAFKITDAILSGKVENADITGSEIRKNREIAKYTMGLIEKTLAAGGEINDEVIKTYTDIAKSLVEGKPYGGSESTQITELSPQKMRELSVKVKEWRQKGMTDNDIELRLQDLSPELKRKIMMEGY